MTGWVLATVAALTDAVAGGLGIVLLALPVLGVVVTYVLICRQAGTLLAIARIRRRLSATGPVADS